jgi:hypothetical protein
VLSRQQADLSPLGALIVLKADVALAMHDLVVPGLNVPVMLRRARIEVRRDVAVLTAEDDKHLLSIGD